MSGMRKILALFLIAAGSVCLFGAPAAANHNGGSVTICHRTNSDQNPYVVISPDEAAVDGAAPANGDHYLEHQGPVWNSTLKDQKIEWGDIIPPVPGHHDGLNWTVEGQAIYNNGCAPVPPGTTTTTSTTSSTTTSSTTSTTVLEPTTTTTPSTVPLPPVETTTTTVVAPTVPTTAPPAPEQTTTAPPRPTVSGTQERTSLPVTGTEHTTILMAFGVMLILAGVALGAGARRASER